MEDPRWTWAFKTNDQDWWVVIAARPAGDRAYAVRKELIPQELRRSRQVRLGRNVLEIDLGSKVFDLARARGWKSGVKFHVGWFDFADVT